MCGIAGIYLKDPDIVDSENDRVQFDRMVDELLLGNEVRGRDATGFVAANKTAIQMDKSDVPASVFIKTRRRAWMKKGTRMVLGHTRLATQGAPEHNENNHPVMHGSTFVTHNGHIRNDDQVFKDLKMERYAEVDSVAIAAALDHYGFDNAKAALEKLGGAFAIAAINPVDNADTLLLAKGPSYPPIAYYENKHMLVWASEAKTIRDAWEKILGTPPVFSAIKYLAAGDAIWVRDGEVELTTSFFSPRYTTTSTTTTGSRSSWTPSSGYTPPSGSRTYSSSRGVTTILDLKEPMKAYRATGGGRAITYENRKDMTEAQLAMHNNKWVVCLHCNETVADMCMINHSEWGSICWDCLAEGMLRKNKRQNDSKKRGAEWAEMSDEDMEMLEDFADIDLDTVDAVVKQVSEEVGLNYNLIFWLLFFSDNSNLGNSTEQLRERLNELYMYYEGQLFEGQLADNNESATCVVDQIIPPSHQLMAGDKPDELPTVLGKCDRCRKKAKVYFNGHRWCNRHFSQCIQRACKDDPVGYTEDGMMWCHKHSRGKKGLKYLEKAKVEA